MDSQKLPIDKVLVAYYVLKFGFGLFEESQILFLGHLSLISGNSAFGMFNIQTSRPFLKIFI